MESLSAQRTIALGIRQRIVKGEWPAGSRLPTRDALSLLFNTSPSNVQAAMRRLVTEGSVVTRKRAGAFVAAEPPECCRFALVMSSHASHAARGPSFFLDQLSQTAQRVASVHPGWSMDVWTAGNPQLEDLIASGAFAGILYFGAPSMIPAAAATGIPLAMFNRPGQSPLASINIFFDNQTLFDLSLRSHLARGRTRIGVLDTGTLVPVHEKHPAKPAQHLVTAMGRAGATSRPAWIQFVDPLKAYAVYQTALVMLEGLAAARPEALILMDDHLLPPVLAAIRTLGLRVPADVSISVLNFADPKQRPDGCIRIGYDIQELVLEVLRRLSLLRQGKMVSSDVCVTLAER